MTGVRAERRALLRALATVPVSRSPVPSSTLRHSADRPRRGPLILIAGRHGVPNSARLLAGIGVHSPTRLLVAVAADQWAADRPGRCSSADGRRRRPCLGPGVRWRTSAPLAGGPARRWTR